MMKKTPYKSMSLPRCSVASSLSFFLTHLDLHFPNVFLNRKHEVEAILDRKLSGILPIEVASAPSRCLVKPDADDQLEISPSTFKHLSALLGRLH